MPQLHCLLGSLLQIMETTPLRFRTSIAGTYPVELTVDDGNGGTATQSFDIELPSYYWVGGSGSWNDLSHWVTSSGGSTFHTNAPSANDNVYFDANSFSAAGQTVSVSASAADCKSMDWTGVTNGPEFDIDNELNVYGSLTFSSNMTLLSSGSYDLNFKSTATGNTVTFAENAWNGHMYFEGVGGEWTLQDSISIPNNFRTITCRSRSFEY